MKKPKGIQASGVRDLIIISLQIDQVSNHRDRRNISDVVVTQNHKAQVYVFTQDIDVRESSKLEANTNVSVLRYQLNQLKMK